MPDMDSAIKKLEKVGLREIIGDASVTPDHAQKTGADYTTNEAVDEVDRCSAKLWHVDEEQVCV